MKREEYLDRIRALLQNLPPEDLERSLAFYAESIADRMEDGMSEEEAVASMESPEEAANAILLEQPLPTLVKVRVKERRQLSALEILLLVLGFPLWLPLLLTALVLVFTFILLAWVLVLVPASVCLALGGSAIAVLFAGVLSLTKIALPALLAAPGACSGGPCDPGGLCRVGDASPGPHRDESAGAGAQVPADPKGG